MLKALETLFEKLATPEPVAELSQQDINLATAALLVEVASSDTHIDDSEWQQLQALLVSQCQLSETEAEVMAQEARVASADSTSLYDFTQSINRHCSHPQKLELVRGLWKVAFADGKLDKYEEHIIRRIADLIHVSHREFIQAKISVRDNH